VFAALLMTFYGFLLGIYPFLAVTLRVNANVVVAEGWFAREAA
jgi:hypothetical protein